MSDQGGGTAGGGELPPAGWYADPTQAGQQRYWDGQQWTDHTAPGTPAATSESTASGGEAAQWPAASAGSSGAWAGSGAAGAKPDPWLWQSIVATIFCCLPLGIVGIVFAAQAQGAISAGDYATAREKAGKARTWTLAAAGIGVVLIVLWLIFVVVAGSGAFMEGFDQGQFG